MKKNEEFYVSYIEGSLGNQTKKTIKKFALLAIFVIVGGALIFSFSQKPFKNSTFELATATKIIGVFHENPYPMLRVQVAENTFKNVLLLGFGKSSANPFLEKIQEEVTDLIKRKSLGQQMNNNKPDDDNKAERKCDACGKIAHLKKNVAHYFFSKTAESTNSDNNLSLIHR